MTNPTETLTVERLDELEEIARRATQGEWRAEADMVRNPDSDTLGPIAETFRRGAEQWRRDAAHIAATQPETALKVYALAREGLSGRIEIERLTAEFNANVDRLKACEHITTGDEGWETLRNLCPSTAPVATLVDAYKAERARVTKAEVELAAAQETWTDEYGTTWTPPTAWAYARACRVMHEAKARAEAAEARVRGLEEALRKLLDVHNSAARPLGVSFDEDRQAARAATKALTSPTEPAPVVETKHRYRGAGPWPSGEFYVWDNGLSAIRWQNGPMTTLTEAQLAADQLNNEVAAEPGEGDHHGG